MDYFMDKREIGKRLKAIRKTKYKSQEAFAEALYISDRKTVSKWETGETEIPITRLAEICDLLDCDLDYLFGKIEVYKNQTSNVMLETGLSEEAAEVLLNNKYTDTLNAVLKDENFLKLLEIISEWAEADLNNTHTNLIKDHISRELRLLSDPSSKSDISETTDRILRRLSKDGHSAIYRPIATETANKMFDTVTDAMYKEATNNG